MKDDNEVKVYTIQRQVIQVSVYAIVDENGKVHITRGDLDIYNSLESARGRMEYLNSKYKRAKGDV